jgi:hypothetical protein
MVSLQAEPDPDDFSVASKNSGCDAVDSGFQDRFRRDEPPEGSRSNYGGCHMGDEEFSSDHDQHNSNCNQPDLGRISTLPQASKASKPR